MNTLVFYDSKFGNTEKIAKAIADGLAPAGDVKMLHVEKATVKDVTSPTLLIVGSPTQGGRATQTLLTFFESIPEGALRNVRVAAFDTRFSPQGRGVGMRLLLKIVDYAAGRIAKGLVAKGGTLATPPEGFIVEDKEGPLKKGELERAAEWARGIAKSLAK